MEVKVYSTKECPWCKKVKAFLNENKITFKELDVGENESLAKEMFEKSGQLGVPVTEVNGKIIKGFDEEKLKEALEL